MSFFVKRQVMSSIAAMPAITHSNLLVPMVNDTTPVCTEPVKLREVDAIEIWIARWLRVPLKALIERYKCDSRRLYEIWWGERFPGSRAKAETEFRSRYPGLAETTSFGYRRIPRDRPSEDQLGFFE